MTKNIWDNFKFTSEPKKSAFDYLKEQSEGLTVATSGELKVEIEAIDAYLDEEPPRLAALYMPYDVAPKLGNFRRKILTVAEYSEEGRYPVDIVCNIDSDKIVNISESNFLDKVDFIMKKSLVRTSIENLFRQSLDSNKYEKLPPIVKAQTNLHFHLPQC